MPSARRRASTFAWLLAVITGCAAAPVEPTRPTADDDLRAANEAARRRWATLAARLRAFGVEAARGDREESVRWVRDPEDVAAFAACVTSRVGVAGLSYHGPTFVLELEGAPGPVRCQLMVHLTRETPRLLLGPDIVSLSPEVRAVMGRVGLLPFWEVFPFTPSRPERPWTGPGEAEALRVLAEAGDIDAMFELGMLPVIDDDSGAERETSERTRWLERAARGGHLGAARELVQRAGDRKDNEAFREWNRVAAEGGDPTAMLQTAHGYRHGLMPDEYSARAERWFRRALEAGSRQAAEDLATWREMGWLRQEQE